MLRETITIFFLVHHVKIFHSAGTCKRSFVISNQIWIITFQEIKISISIFNDKLYYTAKYLTSVMISYIRKAGLEIMRGFLWEGEAIYFRDHNTWGHLSGLVSVAVPCVHGLWYKCIIYLSESMKHSHQFPVIFFSSWASGHTAAEWACVVLSLDLLGKHINVKRSKSPGDKNAHYLRNNHSIMIMDSWVDTWITKRSHWFIAQCFTADHQGQNHLMLPRYYA